MFIAIERGFQMKRLAISLILVLLLFGACRESLPNETTTVRTIAETFATNPTEQSTTETGARTTVWKTNPDTGLPKYVPGNVILDPGYDISLGEDPYKCSYRYVYYTVSGILTDYYGQKEVSDYLESLGNSREWKEPKEMPIVSVIKHFKIPKEKFIELNNQHAEAIAGLASSGINVDTEELELPNADIIYTFDNDIINEYYRRE